MNHLVKLPRLPIPTLQESISRYLASIKPLQTPVQHAETTLLANNFLQPNNLGDRLQQRLLAHDKLQVHSWLEDWWFKAAYHSWVIAEYVILMHANNSSYMS